MSILRVLLSVPQNLDYHPEGSVIKHCYLVRRALPQAVTTMQTYMLRKDYPFSRFREFTKRDLNILRLAAWLHDIGKASATTSNLKSIGHEKIPHLLFGLRILRKSPLWRKIYLNSNKADRRELFFVVRNHMDQMGKKFQNRWIDNEGKYDPAVQLLLTFMIMDRLGRILPSTFPLERMLVVAMQHLKRRTRQQKLPEPDTPVAFVEYLSNKGLNSMAIAAALRGKRAKGLPHFLNLSDLDIAEMVT